MKRFSILSLALLLCSYVAFAQQNNPSTQDSQASNSGQNSIQGCLSKTDNGFMLTSDIGTTYQLSGSTSQLSKHVGHEVQINGTVMQSNPTSSSQMSGQMSSSQPSIDVSSVKHISKTCSANNNSQTPSSSQTYPK